MSVKLSFCFYVFLVFISCAQEPAFVYLVDVQVVDDFEEEGLPNSIERIKKRLGFIGSEIQVLQKNEKELKLTFKSDVTETEVRRILTTPGKLAFYKTKNGEQMAGLIAALSKQESFPELGSVLKATPHPSMSMLGFSKAKDTALMNQRLQDPQIKRFLDVAHKNIKFAWGIPDKGTDALPLFALLLDENDKPSMYGDIVEAASASRDVIGRPSISLFVPSGKWEELTRLAAKERFAIAIVLDDIVYTAPIVSQPITGGRTEISGHFTEGQARTLAMMLGVGHIPELRILQLNQQSNK